MQMDKTVIEEIAAQLGMAADQAGAFIGEHLPDYAALQAWKLAAPLLVLASALAVCAIAALVLYRVMKRRARAESGGDVHAGEIFDYCERDETALSFGFMVAVGGALAFAIIIFFGLFLNGAEIVGWICYPEAQLIDTALSMLGK